MQTSTDTIASWEERPNLADALFQQDVIATEVGLQESPEWRACIDALLRTWTEASQGLQSDVVFPSRSAIQSALTWIAFLRMRFPFAPPTCIVPEPDGGLIVERRVTRPDGREYVWELTFYNDGPAEATTYVDGRVIELGQIPRQPE